MITKTLTLIRKNLSHPEESRSFSQGKVDVVHLDAVSVGRIILQPGWKWSTDVKPIVGTDSCQASHTQYVISGRLMIAMDDGAQMELVPGDAAYIPPGHDAWVVGNEPFVAVDFTGMKDYAKPE